MTTDPANAPKKSGPSLNTRWYTAHSVGGALILIPLFIIVFAGTIAFFRLELIPWQSPALRNLEAKEIREIDSILVDALAEMPREAAQIWIDMPETYKPVIKVRWLPERGGEWFTRAYNPADGSPIDHELVSSEFSDHIYHWHYLDPIPRGLLISGLISLVWFALSISGVYIHRKKLISQFRGPKKRSGRILQSWLHTVSATLTLPLHLVYGVTGAIFGLGTIAIPVVAFVGFNGDQEAFMAEIFVETPRPQFTETLVDLPALDPFLARALEAFPGTRIRNLFIDHPHDEGAQLHVHFLNENNKQGEAIFNLHQSPDPIYAAAPGEDQTTAMRIISYSFYLHFGNFGGLVIKLLYLAFGAFLTTLVYAASRMWVLRRQRNHPKSTALVERLFDGFALGMAPAIAIYAWVTRLLPDSVADRGHVEINIFHGAWVVIGLLILALGTGPRTRKFMALGSIAMLAVIPLIDGLRYGHWPWSAACWNLPSVGIINLILLLAGTIALAHTVVSFRTFKSATRD